jgi:hypothetical protein
LSEKKVSQNGWHTSLLISHIVQYSPTLYLINPLFIRMAVLQRILFREPDGQWQGLFFALLSVVCILGGVYFGIVLNGTHSLLFLGIAFAFYGIAESLPPKRQRSAGALRVLGIGVLGVLLALVVFAPDAILG